MLHFLQELVFNPAAVVTAAGYLGVSLIIFAETGILLGIFLPGDSLLFAAGLVASQGVLDPVALAALVALAAIAGDATGYWIGRAGGEAVLGRYPRLIKPEHIERTEQFYARWGARAVVLARFVPIVRTIVPVLAGVGRMRYDRFFPFNVIGGILWGPLVIALGYFLGRSIPNAAHYLLPLSLLIVLISFLPFFIRLVRNRRMRSS
ncbi:MAG TPA: DedA family protein [Candidatus Paceibacterota bacterium]|nr:DedA family protein [Candidatus Paceibacterota bacterium]